MALVFISYSRGSRETARLLVSDLEALGHDVWLDEALTGGQFWWNLILSEIRKCEVFAFLIDPNSLKSVACKLEHEYAAKLKKSILPVLVADGVSLDLLPPALAQIQLVDYRPGNDQGSWRSLSKALIALPPSPMLPDPLPEPPPAPVSYLASLKEQLETPEDLTQEKQSFILLRLKHALRDPNDQEIALKLLRTFRSRGDLFVQVAEEIDLLLNTPQAPLEAIRAENEPTPAFGGLYRIKGVRQLRANESLLKQVALSYPRIWLSLLVGFALLWSRLDNPGPPFAEFLESPSWSIPAAVLLLTIVAWNEMGLRPISFKLLFIFLLVTAAGVLPGFAASDYLGSQNISQFRFLVVLWPLIIFATASKIERLARTPSGPPAIPRPVSHKVTWLSLGIGLVLMAIASQSNWVLFVWISKPAVALAILIYFSLTLVSLVIKRLI